MRPDVSICDPDAPSYPPAAYPTGPGLYPLSQSRQSRESRQRRRRWRHPGVPFVFRSLHLPRSSLTSNCKSPFGIHSIRSNRWCIGGLGQPQVTATPGKTVVNKALTFYCKVAFESRANFCPEWCTSWSSERAYFGFVWGESSRRSYLSDSQGLEVPVLSRYPRHDWSHYWCNNGFPLR